LAKKKKMFTVYFDIACMIDIEAKTEEAALNYAREHVSEAEQTETHSFRAIEQ